jgi:crotonobetainyl-CoA:carnitine CoA-transferase CaiB-like acyl-CoA transferase
MCEDLQQAILNAFQHPQLPTLVMPSCEGNETLPSWFNVSDLARFSIGAAGASVTRFVETATGQSTNVSVDTRLANLWFGMTLQPKGWSIPPAWDSVAGDYQARDGWIRLHTNAPHHKKAALSVLQCGDDRAAVEKAVKQWKSSELELAIVKAGGVAAALHSMAQWQQHPQGRAVALEPLVDWTYSAPRPPKVAAVDRFAPLKGIKILDLTRVLAGPVATRFLAAFGASVLRIDPPDWDEPGLIPEVTPGKRCAGLDIKTASGLAHLKALLKSADILIHGYRADALDKLGLSRERRQQLNPDLIDICLNAYGWTGPWSNRRGFDSLVQMSSGIAHYGMTQCHQQKPVPLPVQALDHATGYLMATSAMHALTLRTSLGIVASARCSLVRTAQLLLQTPQTVCSASFPPLTDQDLSSTVEETYWGEARRVRFPLIFSEIEPHWQWGAQALRSSPAQW